MFCRRKWEDAGTRVRGVLCHASMPCVPAGLRRGAAAQGWARRWWGTLAVAILQRCPRRLDNAPLTSADEDLPIAEVLHLAADQAPNRLPVACAYRAWRHLRRFLTWNLKPFFEGEPSVLVQLCDLSENVWTLCELSSRYS